MVSVRFSDGHEWRVNYDFDEMVNQFHRGKPMEFTDPNGHRLWINPQHVARLHYVPEGE